MGNVLVELRVRGVALDGPGGAPLVVLEDKSRGRCVSLPAGPFEASAIIMEIEGIEPPRLLAHDLLAEVFQEGGFVLDGVVLLPDRGGASARLEYRRGQRTFSKVVGPADAIALAIKLGAPVEADPELLDALRSRPADAESTRPGPEDALRQAPKILVLDDWRQRAVGA